MDKRERRGDMRAGESETRDGKEWEREGRRETRLKTDKRAGEEETVCHPTVTSHNLLCSGP